MDLISVEDVDNDTLQQHSLSPAGSDIEFDQEGDNSSMIDIQTTQVGKNGSSNGKPSSISNAKDPNRPRRKKARRACYACQRAHLTCGDERPCQRCIKRGLADACQDGVRKKAKYLHDAPNEALLPGASNHYSRADLKRQHSTTSLHEENVQQQPTFFPTATAFPMFNSSISQMPPPSMHERTTSFGQQSSSGSVFSMHQPMPSPTSIRHSHSQSTSYPTSAWTDPPFGAEDPSLFNFDLASMNFGNHYGALEFGMLGKMATGAGDTPDSEVATQRSSVVQYQMPFGSMSESPHLGYGESGMMDWANAGLYGMPRPHGPNAFAIESNNVHFTSPEANCNTPENLKHEDPPIMNINLPNNQQEQRHLSQQPQQQQQMNLNPANFLPLTSTTATNNNLKAPTIPSSTQQPTSAPVSTAQLKAKSQFPTKPVTPLKRPRDPSQIYTAVTSPYPYTTGFHSLIAYLQTRFSTSPSKTLQIAKSLASIRPSFIATTKTLNREDLIFMEKCFQRTLWEYEGFIESVGTPTIVARRTGEIAAVGKEFQILTGWRKGVLLGREPNLNVNRGHSGDTPRTGSGSGANTHGRATGTHTPALRHSLDESSGAEGGRQQPVFLAELLDDDSVVQFYEDFARLAFGDSRGSVMAKGKLLKYRTKDDEIAAKVLAAGNEAQETRAQNGEPRPDSKTPVLIRSPTTTKNIGIDPRQDLRRADSFALARPQDAKKGISGEKGMQKLGAQDGKVDCAYCWTVKRDVFDIPMLIVMNFLPCI